MANLPWARNGLIDTLGVLASDAEDQVEHVRSLFRVVGEIDPLYNVDELALEFSDFALLLPQVRRAEMMSAEAASAIEAVDAQLDAMSGEEHAELWTVEAVRTSAEWTKVRELARTALRLLQSAGS